MPLPVENLTPDSKDGAIQDAISESMRVCMKEGGRTQKECAGMIYDMAEKAIGREIPYRRQQ
jgi:hypothetical protein